MVRTVDIDEAKTHLSRLVDAEFIILRDGRPVARVVPIRDEQSVPRIDAPSDIAVPDDFDEMGSEAIAALFGARPVEGHESRVVGAQMDEIPC